MTRRGANNAPQVYDRRARNQHNGQGPPVPLTLQERLDSSLSASYPEKNNHNKKDCESNICHGGESQFSLPQYQNDRADNPRELNSNGMESNPARSSSPSRGRGRGKNADRGGWGGRGNSDSRGRGKGYQGRNDDGRGRNDIRNDTRSDTSGNSSLITLPVSNDSDKEFDENVRDLSVTETSRLARFSNHTSEQASYDELKVARQRERRDLIAKGLIDDPDNRSTLANAVEFVGTCMDMCPLFERAERSAQFNIDKWEFVGNDSTSNGRPDILTSTLEKDPQTGKTDKRYAVKKFHRPAAGADAPLPSDVRPPRVLVSTLAYLIKNFLDSDERLKMTHGFLRDRTRSIRQDFTMQSYTGSEAVTCHEIIARLHIIALHKLADEPVTKFSAQQEMEQLQKVLTTLQQLYDDARDVGIFYPNEAEFRAYQLIIHLRDQDQERQAQRWAPKVFDSEQVQQALKFFMLAQRNNAEQVHLRVGNPESCMNFAGTIFRLLKSKLTSYLQACLLEFHFNDIRKTALKAMKNTYRVGTKMVFLKDIKEMLGYESEEFVLRDCRHYGLSVEQTEVDGNILWYLVIVKGGGGWNENAPALQVNFHSSIERKIGDRTIADICYGNSGEDTARFNPVAIFPIPGPAGFGKPPTAALQTTSVGSVPGKPVGFNNAAVSHQTVVPAFATGSHRSFSETVPPPTSQPSSNVFQNVANSSAQHINVFQKAASNTSNQTLNPFHKTLQSTRSLIQPIASAFGPLGQALPAAPIVPAFGPVAQAASTLMTAAPLPTFASGSQKSFGFNPVPAFSSENSTLAPAANVFKQPVAKRLGLFPPADVATTSPTTFAQSSVPRDGLASGSIFIPQTTSPLTVPESPQAEFQLGPAKAKSSGFFQQQATSSSPQPTFKVPPSRTISDGLFQPQNQNSPTISLQPGYFQKAPSSTSASSSASRSVFDHPPQVSPSGLFQQTPPSSSLPPSSITSTSFFPPNPTNSISSLSGGSVFESHSVQNQFPTNFFSLPPGTPVNYEDNEEDDAKGVHAPSKTSGSLFDRIQAPSQDLFPQSATDAQKAVLSFTPTSLSSDSPSTSFTVPVSSVLSDSVVHPSAGVSVVAPGQPPTQQVVPTKKPLLSRASAWDFANKLFDDIINEEVTRTIQEAVDEDQARIIETVATENYAEQEKFVAKKIVLDVAADQFYLIRSGASAFYSWKKKARKLMLKKLRAERLLRESLPTPAQWRPVQIPEWVFNGPHDVIQQMNNMTYKSVPLKEIFQPKVEAAFWSTGGGGGHKWRLLINSSNLKQDANHYWWIEKMIGNNESRISTSKRGTFEAQFQIEDLDKEVREIGGFVFGCSADYTISNDERFAQDKRNLHEAVNWLSERTAFEKLAVMVICYRSPLDHEDADPFGRDLGRTSGPGRQARISAIRKALDLDALKKNKGVVPGDLVLIENLQDCDLESPMRRLAELVLHTVNPKVAEMMSHTPSPNTVTKQNSVKRKRAAYQQSLSVGSPKPTRAPKPAGTSNPTETPKPAGTPNATKCVVPSTPSNKSKSKRQRVRNEINNVGMQTTYFKLKSRGLHLDWDKFPVPGGGTLGDGVENPVAEEYILTTSPVTTPVTTPERRPDVDPRRQSPMDGLKQQLTELEDMLGDVHNLFDDNLADLKNMKAELKEAIAQGWP